MNMNNTEINAEVKPNMVFIMTDQHHAQYLNCLGRKELITPNFDDLASQSAVFSSAYTPSPICGPARAAIFTGQYPHQNGIHRNWIPLKDDRALLTHRLAEAGYYNAMIGKLHLSPIKDDHGFHFRRMCDSPHDVYDKAEVEENSYLPWAAKDMGIKPQRLAELAGKSERCPTESSNFWIGEEWTDDAHQMTTWTGNEAVSFIQNYHQKQPFFMHISFFGPHHPYATCEPWDSMYDPNAVGLPPTLHMKREGRQTGMHFEWPEERWREVIAKYSGNISAIDVQLGRIISTLKKKNLWRNTLIVFTSDHGDHMGEFSQLGKGTMLESSARIPFFVKQPGESEERHNYSEVINAIDIYPTLLDYAGVAQADNVNHDRSLRRVLEGDSTWQNKTFSSFCPQSPFNGQLMLIKDHLKGVGFLKDGVLTMELYDLSAEVPDLLNLAHDPKYEEILKQMQVELEVWCQEKIKLNDAKHNYSPS
jgi:arylsulfatase A-like enzyme